MRVFKSLVNSPFLKQNLIMFIGGALIGLGNYLYYPVLARLLDPAPYGEVQALVALFAQMLIFLTVLGQVTTNIVANTDKKENSRAIFELEKFALFITIGLSALLLLFSWQLKAFFQFESVWPFVLLLIALIITVPGTFRQAFLRAKKDFTQISLAQIIGAFAKLALSASLVLIGLNTAGAIGGIVIAQIYCIGIFGLFCEKTRIFLAK